MIKAIFLFLILIGTWLLLSGLFVPSFMVSAIISALVAVLVSYRMTRKAHTELPLCLNWRIFFYPFWLLKEIIVSAWGVTKCIWQLQPEVAPTLRWIPSTQESDLGRMIYANSVTLTPGTVSVAVRPNKIHVHALVPENIDHLLDGAMDRFVTDMTIPSHTKAAKKEGSH